jgi:hypothetical protein
MTLSSGTRVMRVAKAVAGFVSPDLTVSEIGANQISPLSNALEPGEKTAEQESGN